jgi:hypothetical protein
VALRGLNGAGCPDREIRKFENISSFYFSYYVVVVDAVGVATEGLLLSGAGFPKWNALRMR